MTADWRPSAPASYQPRKESNNERAKRTPERWDNENGPYVYAHIPGGRPNGEYIMQVYCGNGAGKPLSKGQNTANAAFIAACAGRAEAGWRATKAAIATLFACYPDGNIAARSLNAQHMAESILAAWPLELLTLP